MGYQKSAFCLKQGRKIRGWCHGLGGQAAPPTQDSVKDHTTQPPLPPQVYTRHTNKQIGVKPANVRFQCL